jgi:predicted nucleic acid-binding Zn ribbon protein
MLQDRICRECSRSFLGGPRAYYCPSCREERKRANWRDYQKRKRQGLVRQLGSIDTCERCGKDYTVEAPNQRFCRECQPVHAVEYDRVTALEFYHEHKEELNPVRYERRRIGPQPCEVCGTVFEPHTKTRTCSTECRIALKNKKWREIYGPRYVERVRLRLKRETLKHNLVSRQRKCARCGAEYMGYGVQKFCDACRDVAAEERMKRIHERQKDGTARKLGTLVPCKQCGSDFELQQIRQEICDTCKSTVMPQVNRDRIRVSAAKMRSLREKEGTCPLCGKDWIDPIPNAKGTSPTYCLRCQEYYRERHQRRQKAKVTAKATCEAPGCDKPLTTKTAKFCSDRCRSRVHKAQLREERISAGLCPQCGGDMAGSEGAKHCAACKEKFAAYYRRKKEGKANG